MSVEPGVQEIRSLLQEGLAHVHLPAGLVDAAASTARRRRRRQAIGGAAAVVVVLAATAGSTGLLARVADVTPAPPAATSPATPSPVVSHAATPSGPVPAALRGVTLPDPVPELPYRVRDARVLDMAVLDRVLRPVLEFDLAARPGADGRGAGPGAQVIVGTFAFPVPDASNTVNGCAVLGTTSLGARSLVTGYQSSYVLYVDFGRHRVMITGSDGARLESLEAVAAALRGV